MSGAGQEGELLSIQNVRKTFGGIVALDRVDLAVPRGEVLGLIGPNGAGKTTLMNVITGVHDPTSGKIEFDEGDITDLTTFQIANRGLIRTFQENRHFEEIDSFENIRTALIENSVMALDTYFSSILSDTRKESQEVVNAAATLAGLSAEDLRKHPSDMTHLQRTKLSLARAAAHDPALLLLDEPLAGLTTEEIGEILEVIRTMNEEDITIILIDHNVGHVVDIADRVTVLDQGTIIREGDPERIVNDERVQKAYFGE